MAYTKEQIETILSDLAATINISDEMFEKADYCSFRKIGFLNKANEEYVSSLYYSDSHKYA